MRVFWTIWCAVFFAWDLYFGTANLFYHQWGWAVFDYLFAGLMIWIYLRFKRQWAREDELRDEFTKYNSFPRR